MPTHYITDYTRQIGPEDFEEVELLTQWCEAMNKLEELELSYAKSSKQDANALNAKVKELAQKLGYEPKSGRPPRPRGRIRSQAIPSPLPAKGTELLSAIGDTYKVLGYAAMPTASGLSMVIYEDHLGRTVVRSIAHLFAGSLSTNEPFVTWPEDPRGLKPGKAVPLNKRRALSKKVLAADEHADPDLQPLTAEEKRRRGRWFT